MALKQNSKPYKCEYCNTSYSKESTLLVHVCERKRRALQRDEKRVQTGFYAFNQFYKLGTGAKKDKTYEEFCKSPYYNAFVKFGSFVTNVRPLYPEKYIDYIVTSGIKIDKWCDEAVYEKYATELIQREDVTTALERSIRTMMEWAVENPPAPWNHYFRHVNLNRAVFHIKDGKISPWVILNSDTGKQMMSQFNEEQLGIVYQIMDPAHWSKVFKNKPCDLTLAKDIIRESKL